VCECHIKIKGYLLTYLDWSYRQRDEGWKNEEQNSENISRKQDAGLRVGKQPRRIVLNWVRSGDNIIFDHNQPVYMKALKISAFSADKDHLNAELSRYERLGTLRNVNNRTITTSSSRTSSTDFFAWTVSSELLGFFYFFFIFFFWAVR